MKQQAPLNRRDFLRNRADLRGIAAAAAVVDEAASPAPEPAPEPPPAAPLMCVARPAMACRFEVRISAADGHLVSAACAALDEVQRLEARLSAYRPSSDICRLNRHAADVGNTGDFVGERPRPARLDAELFALLSLSARLSEKTGGCFDISAGALVKVWGFFKGPRRVPSDAEIAEALGRSGMRHLRLDPADKSVRFARAGVELNLGSIGKGHALDRAARVLTSRRGPSGERAVNWLMHAGFSSLLASGSAEGPGRPCGWWVTVRDPLDPQRAVARVRLGGGGPMGGARTPAALSTSSAAYRYFLHEGRRYGHTLDPRTGRPAEGVRGVTVIAPTAAEADAYSTALMVMGPERARAFCAAHPRVRALMFPEPAPGRPAEMLNFGLPAEDFELLQEPLSEPPTDGQPDCRGAECSAPAEPETWEPEV